MGPRDGGGIRLSIQFKIQALKPLFYFSQKIAVDMMAFMIRIKNVNITESRLTQIVVIINELANKGSIYSD